MKLKATIRASLWYMAAMVTAIGALLVSSGIEHSANGWEMLGWAAAALVPLRRWCCWRQRWPCWALAAVRTRKTGKATRRTKPRRTR